MLTLQCNGGRIFSGMYFLENAETFFFILLYKFLDNKNTTSIHTEQVVFVIRCKLQE